MYGTAHTGRIPPRKHLTMQAEFFTSNRTTSDEEVERLESVELEAARRHGEAMERGDLSAARNAKLDWLRASDALTDYVATHPDLYRDSG
jgi:hypothetical protein